MQKPAYRIPSMTEIQNTPLNNYKVVSLFSGVGGSSLGYRMAGFQVVYVNEFIEHAQQMYALNNPGVFIDPRDVREVTAEDILSRTGLEVGELDVLDGSPPCAQFSTANPNPRLGQIVNYSDKAQRTDDLFLEYIRLLDQLKPKVFIAENVVGLRKGASKLIYEEFLDRMRQCGYTVSCEELNAKNLGVPQSRSRLIFIGVRNDLNIKPAYPENLSYSYTVGEVLPYLERAFENTGGIWKPVEFIDSVCPVIRVAGRTHLFAVDKARQDTVRRMNFDEIKLLSSFPNDFIITGSKKRIHERISRAVPPLMMYRIAKAVQENILDKLKESK